MYCTKIAKEGIGSGKINGHSVTNKKAVIEGDGNEGIAKQGEDCFVAASGLR